MQIQSHPQPPLYTPNDSRSCGSLRIFFCEKTVHLENINSKRCIPKAQFYDIIILKLVHFKEQHNIYEYFTFLFLIILFFGFCMRNQWNYMKFLLCKICYDVLATLEKNYFGNRLLFIQIMIFLEHSVARTAASRYLLRPVDSENEVSHSTTFGIY